MQQAAKNIERLLQFSVQQNLITSLDVYVARNELLDLLQISEPYQGEIVKENLQTPVIILRELLDYAKEKGLFDAQSQTLEINFETKMMGILMPRESEVAKTFEHLKNTKGISAATDYFYHLCIVSNYIRTEQIAKNRKWEYESTYGPIEITINLTKPEKDPKTIALERAQPASSYPKCMLCAENIGYAGRVNFPARQTHRIVPITLCEEEWFLQYSPYVYYPEHCIIFDKKHEVMQITSKTLHQIFDFVRQFPHYTCGSNADLPIVGGSILSHMHFQGGKYQFPMQKAKAQQQFFCEDFPNITIETVLWPVSVVRVSGHDEKQVLAFAQRCLDVWREYQDEQADIFPYTQTDAARVAHNTITPILHYDSEKGYVFHLVPRNNRTSETFPEGIFHPHREIHHVKKENIGLIEVMGLAILPGRLEKESQEIEQVLCGEKKAKEVQENLPVHADWIAQLVEQYGVNCKQQQAKEILKQEIGSIFTTGLEHAGVFKQTPAGQTAQERFLKALGCTLLP